MAQSESHADRTQKSPALDLIPPEFAAMGEKRIKELAEMQTELIEKLQEANKKWLDRLQLESSLASEFGAKLTAARSIPETATAYQEWASRRVDMATEDAKHLLADAQKFMETGARLLSSSFLSPGHGW